MKSNRNSKWVGFLLLGLVGICLTASSARAQKAYEGRFTLPFEAKWGQSTLPAGDYYFVLDHASVEGNLTILSQDKKLAAVIHVAGASESNSAANSSLIAVRSGGTYRIRVLHTAEIGMAFTFGVPRAEQRQMLAREPELIRRVPILVASR